ncbi:hypothetical protein C8N35_10442 [Breoghania corrubedonensis]|uniref:AsmA-like protein n=1 Tax=Breoghania corrubedonensis TaxID=665038 RepID=A0A2T5V9I5_9HYPH|nr:hypothetical protein [Breoghania corrubedonensis]PTW60419.1 hypothetical protein C8N35_10442 [Breoghania corrubedonensis]
MHLNISRLQALGLAGLLITTSPAFAARQGPEIVSGWFEELVSAGASEAKYANISQIGDTTTVDNVEIRFPFDFNFGKDGAFSGAVTLTSSKLSFEGLSETDDTYSADAIRAADGTTIVFDTTVPDPESAVSGNTGAPTEAEKPGSEDKAQSDAEPKSSPDTKGDITITKTVPVHNTSIYDGLEISNATWQRYKAPEITREHSFSDTVKYLAHVLEGTSAESIAIDRTENDQALSDGSGNKIVQTGTHFSDMEGWRLGRETIASYTAEQRLRPRGGKDQIVKIAMNDIDVVGIDFRPILRAFDPSLFATAQSDTVMEKMAAKDVSFAMPSEEVSVTIDGISAKGFGITPKSADFLPLADRLFAGKEDDPETIVRAMFKLFSGYRLAGAAFDGLQVTSKGTRVGQIDHFEVSDIDDTGLGKVLVEGAGAINPTNAAQFGMSRLMLANLTFPTRDALFALKDAAATGNAPAIMKAIPTIGRVELDDLVVSSATQAGSFSLDKYRLLLDRFIGPIPTDITNTVENLDIPTSFVRNPMSRAIVESLGFDVLKLNQNLRIHWNAETQDLDLEQAHISLENGGSATVKLTLGGVPRFIFENPKRAQEAIATLSVKGGSILIENAPAITRLIEMQATQANVSKEEIRAATIAQIRDVMGPLADTAFASDLTSAADRFMQNPKRLEINLRPENPVPVAQLLGMAATAPQAIPDLLKAGASAD